MSKPETLGSRFLALLHFSVKHVLFCLLLNKVPEWNSDQITGREFLLLRLCDAERPAAGKLGDVNGSFLNI